MSDPQNSSPNLDPVGIQPFPPMCCGSETDPPDPASESPTQTVAPDSTIRYEGIDVSHFQGEIDWQAVRAAGIYFAFAKATQGTSYVDSRFSENWAALKEPGIVRGAYHFFDPSQDAELQAKHFIATVQLESGDLPPALDIEVTERETAAQIDQGVALWLQTVATAFGVQPIIYSDRSFIQNQLGGRFSSYLLWYAEYSVSSPTLPAGDWQNWTFWQYTQSGSVEGIQGNVDRDRFQGTQTEWQKLLVA